MSDSAASLGLNAVFSISDDVSPLVYVDVAEIATINFSGVSVDQVDVTHLKSPNNMQESIPGLLKPGTIDLTGNFVADTSQLKLTTYLQGRTRFRYKITGQMSGSRVYTVTGLGYVAKLSEGPWDANKKVDFAATVQAAGAFVAVVT